VLFRNAAHFRQSSQRRFDLAFQTLRTHPEPLQQRRNDSVRLRHKRGKQVQRLDLLLIVPRGDLLRFLHRLLRFYCEFVEAKHRHLSFLSTTRRF
jgi:hypothetical protein